MPPSLKQLIQKETHLGHYMSESAVSCRLWPLMHAMLTAAILIFALGSFSFLHACLGSSGPASAMCCVAHRDQNLFCSDKFDSARTFARQYIPADPDAS